MGDTGFAGAANAAPLFSWSVAGNQLLIPKMV